jgi:hypothetical protein
MFSPNVIYHNLHIFLAGSRCGFHCLQASFHFFLAGLNFGSQLFLASLYFCFHLDLHFLLYDAYDGLHLGLHLFLIGLSHFRLAHMAVSTLASTFPC